MLLSLSIPQHASDLSLLFPQKLLLWVFNWCQLLTAATYAQILSQFLPRLRSAATNVPYSHSESLPCPV